MFFNFVLETQYQKQDFENLNMQGLNLFGIPLEQDQNQEGAKATDSQKVLKDLIDLTEQIDSGEF